MTHSAKNMFSDLITPVSLILLAIFLRPLIPSLDIAQTEIFVYLPFLLLGPSLLISWKFNQFDSFYFAIMLSVAYAGILLLTLYVENNAHFNIDLYVSALSILLPLNFIIFKLSRVASILSAANVFRFSLISAQVYGIYWAIEHQHMILLDTLNYQFFSDASNLSVQIPAHLPQTGILLFAIAIVMQVVFIISRKKPLESSLLGALVMSFIAVYFADKAFIFFSSFSAAAIMLMVATIQASYNMAYVDTLTALPGRRAMENELKKLGKRYSIAMLDIDHFKNLNDTYGHDVGDQVLRMIAKHIRRVGGGGRPARYGGEEFAIIFPNRNIIEATPFLEIVRANIANASFALRDSDRPKETPKTRTSKQKPKNEISVTISIGVAEKSRAHKTPAKVMKSADDALYRAKNQGRNQVSQ